MKLTRASSHALHALVYLARENSAGPVASHHIAEAEGIPEKFLLKALKPLVSARVLLSLKGPRGGYRLARPAKSITLLEVVEAVGGPVRGDAPPVGMGKDGAAFDGRLQEVCDGAAVLVRERLAKVTLAELAKGEVTMPADSASRTHRFAALALPLLALLAMCDAALAGPPERVSGRMMFDEVAEGLRQYRKETDEERRIEWLRRLAPSRDPRVALELWDVFAAVRGKQTAVIRAVARDCLAEHYATKDGRPLSQVVQGDADRGPGVCSWWSKNGPELRRRAKELPR